MRLHNPQHLQSLPSRERGLKLDVTEDRGAHLIVAPLAGAWIEMVYLAVEVFLYFLSLPSRERGLKYRISFFKRPHHTVAPLAGAWIEICV